MSIPITLSRGSCSRGIRERREARRTKQTEREIKKNIEFKKDKSRKSTSWLVNAYRTAVYIYSFFKRTFFRTNDQNARVRVCLTTENIL